MVENPEFDKYLQALRVNNHYKLLLAGDSAKALHHLGKIAYELITYTGPETTEERKGLEDNLLAIQEIADVLWASIYREMERMEFAD